MAGGSYVFSTEINTIFSALNWPDFRGMIASPASLFMEQQPQIYWYHEMARQAGLKVNDSPIMLAHRGDPRSMMANLMLERP